MNNSPLDKTIVQEVTDLLMENGCTINRPAMLSLAIYVLEREKKAIQSLKFDPPLKEERTEV